MSEFLDCSDEELMHSVQKNNMKAFEALFNKHKKPLLNFLYRYTTDFDRSEDLFQQVFLKVYDKRLTFKGESSFKTWLYTIAMNSALDFIRKEKKESKNISLNVSKIDSVGFDPPAQNLDPSGEVINSELKETLERALSEISDEFRIPFILARFQDLSYQEIADTLKLSLPTVRMRIHRAHKQLSAKLEKYLKAEERKQ